MFQRIFTFVLALLLVYPAIGSAQTAPQPQRVITSSSPLNSFSAIVDHILWYINLLIPFLFGITFIILAWGIVNAWIINGGNSEKIEEGKMLALWGVIGLAVMVGVWALVAIVRSSLFGVS